MTTKEILPENAEYTSHGNDPTWQGNVKDSTKLNTCFPVFCLAMPPEEYWTEVTRCFSGNVQEGSDQPVVGYIEVTCDTLVKSGATGPLIPVTNPPIPANKLYLSDTVTTVYHNFRVVVRPDPSSTAYFPFTHFTFLAVDDACLRASPFEIIVCTDAPDYGDTINPDTGSQNIKEVRLSIHDAAFLLTPVEQLGLTISEAVEESEDWKCLASIPPFTLKVASEDMEVGSEEEAFIVASHAEARDAKAKALEIAPQISKDEVVFDNARRAQLFWAPKRQAERQAQLHKQAEAISKRQGKSIKLRNNSYATGPRKW